MNFDDSFFEDLCSNTKEKKKQHPYSVRRQEFRVSKNCKIQQTSILKTTMGTQPLWTSSIKFEPLRKKYQSADTNTPKKLRNFCLTPQKKRKDQRMLMHTTPRKRLF
jgi:hypothetical protein